MTVTGALVALLVAPAQATSSCNASIGTISSVPTVVYDPFDGVSSSVVFTVEAVNNSSEACTLSLAISSSGPSGTRYYDMGAQKLRYIVESPGGDDYQNDITQPRGSHSLAGGVGKTKTITVQLKVPAGLIAPAGDYVDTLSLRLFRNGSGGATAMGTVRTATAHATLERRAQVNIAGASSSFGPWSVDQIDFHTLSTNEARSAKVQVRATTGVSIKVQSQNSGKLKHTVLNSDPGVLYALKLDGQTMNLAGAYDTLVRSPPVSLDGTSYPMVVTVGNVTGRPAGTYQDLLTITVSPQ